MPEYLAPGVYVEEVDTGSKPIEGVSTSTAGLVGVAERGPVNVPILITSMGEFTRWFGERLNITDFSNGSSDRHCYLPNAVQGFFENGGKRVFVTRVLDTVGATNAAAPLFDRGKSTSANTALLRAAAELTGTAANPPRLVVLDASAIAQNDWIRIGDGSLAEYRKVATTPAADASLIPLNFPLSRSHNAGCSVRDIEATASGGALTLVGDEASGSDNIVVQGANTDITALTTALSADKSLLKISSSNAIEYRFFTSVSSSTAIDASNSQATLQLDSPLVMSYANSATVQLIAIPDPPATIITTTLDTAYTAGDRLLFVTSKSGGFDNSDHIVIVDTGTANKEARLIGLLKLLSLSNGAYEDYPAGSLVEEVTVVADARTLDENTAVNAKTIVLNSVTGLVVGQTLLIGPAGSTRETMVIQQITTSSREVKLVTATGLANAHTSGESVIPAPKKLSADASAGASFLALNNRLGLVQGDVIRLSNVSNSEYLTITSIPGRSSNPVAPDAGNIVVSPPITNDFAKESQVERQSTPAVVTATKASVTGLDAESGNSKLLVARGTAFTSGDTLRLTTGAGQVFYHVLSTVTTPTPDTVTLTDALLFNHPLGSEVVERAALIQVQALDAGAWGNRLRVSVEDEYPGLLAQASLTQFGPLTRIRLSSSAGVEPGTILEIQDPDTEETIGSLLKVTKIDRSTGDITLGSPGLDSNHQAAIAALSAGSYLKVVSREFCVIVRLLRQPDPAMPSRNNTAIDTEVFRYLSMDPRHSRYIHKVIGDINGDLRQSDRRPEGESLYIRVRDVAQDLTSASARITALESVRLGPETLIDILPDGRERAARHALYYGGDSIATLTDDAYIGADSTVPEERTGLQALRNLEEISIVAIPGRTSVKVQNALINHCELLRYRFAVLDGPQPPKDTLTDVQTQRQRFDTKYAAIYYPWLVIPDPFPTNLAQVANYPIPPSGHMLGVYARTDIERGVHKAPANEVVKGIVGLQRLLNKEQQDILNPYPVNINVIRDFRTNNRGIRVYGGRVITSDSDWKYVNVRRLLIFIEASIDRGLQWVVFEPNAEPLWARVKRSVSNFLTLVWRNGALEGTKPEEAFFVKCDRTTMTQTDIDSGRLICLIGVAPVKPAEFVIIRIGLWTAHAED